MEAEAVRTGDSKDQCLPHLAPCSIQSLKVATSAGVRGALWEEAGGMSWRGLAGAMRAMRRLEAGSPGTMAAPALAVPARRTAVAESRRSSRRPAMRPLGSCPWQLKHLSERMGRI